MTTYHMSIHVGICLLWNHVVMVYFAWQWLSSHFHITCHMRTFSLSPRAFLLISKTAPGSILRDLYASVRRSGIWLLLLTVSWERWQIAVKLCGCFQSPKALGNRMFENSERCFEPWPVPYIWLSAFACLCLKGREIDSYTQEFYIWMLTFFKLQTFAVTLIN